MSDITALEESEIREYTELTSGSGQGARLNRSIDTYQNRLNIIKHQCFRPNDTSTVHGVIDELIEQMDSVSEIMNDANMMLDDIFHIINTCILDEEDKKAEEVWGD